MYANIVTERFNRDLQRLIDRYESKEVEYKHEDGHIIAGRLDISLIESRHSIKEHGGSWYTIDTKLNYV